MKAAEEFEAEFYENNPPRRKKTTPKTEHCEKCDESIPSRPQAGMDTCGNAACTCHTQNNVPWEDAILANYSRVAIVDEDCMDGYRMEPAVSFIKDLLQKDRTTLIGRVENIKIRAENVEDETRVLLVRELWEKHLKGVVLTLLKEDSTSAK